MNFQARKFGFHEHVAKNSDYFQNNNPRTNEFQLRGQNHEPLQKTKPKVIPTAADERLVNIFFFWWRPVIGTSLAGNKWFQTVDARAFGRFN